MTTTEALLTRITALEDRVYQLELAGLQQQAPAASKVPAPPTPAQRVPSAPPVPIAPVPVTNDSVDSARVPTGAPASEVLLRWVGVGLVFLAAAFFVSTAITRGWIGPALQLAGAVAIGLALVAWALRLAPARDGWALAAGHGGVAVLGASVLFGQLSLDLYSLGVAIAATVAVFALAVWLAVGLERASIAGSGVVQMLVIPLALGAADEYGPIAFGGWLCALLVATAAVAWFRRWPSLRLVLFATVALPLLATAAEVANGSSTETAVAVTVGVVAIAVFVLGPPIEATLAPKVQPDRRRINLEPISTALDQRLYVSLPAWAWGLFALLFFQERETASWWLALGVAAISAVGLAAFGRRLVQPMLAAGIVGASVLASIGLAGLIDGPGLLVALTVQAMGLAWMALRTSDPLLGSNAAIVGAISGVWAAEGIITAMVDGATLGEHLAHLLVVAGAIAAAVVSYGRSWFPPVGLAAWIGWLGWLASVLGELPQGQMAVSIAWAICGAALFVVGLSSTDRNLPNLGLATLAVTVIKLVTIDLDAVDTIWRAALFFFVGLGLLRLGLMIENPDDRETEDTGERGFGEPTTVQA